MQSIGFRNWLEVGGTGGVGGGLTPPVEVPSDVATALGDYHGKEGSDPKNPAGALPPVKKAPGKLNRRYGRRKPSF